MSKYVKKNERELEKKGKHNLITQVSNDKMKAQRRQRKKGDKTQRKKTKLQKKLKDLMSVLTHFHMIIHFIVLAYSLNSSSIIGIFIHAYPTLHLTSACLSRPPNMQQLIAFVGRGFVFVQVLLPQAISQSVVAYA